MEFSEISLPVNQFGFRLLADRAEQEEMGSALIAPPALFLSLALLKSAASGATRSGLARFLGTDESLSEDERERRVRRLRAALGLGPSITLENVLCANGHRPLSPSFLRRAFSVYGVQVEQDESSLPLRLQSAFQVQLSATKAITTIRENRLLGVRFGTNSPCHGLYVFLPDRVPFWQGRKKSLQNLLNQLNANTWPALHKALQLQEPEGAWAFPELEMTGTVMLKELELGPASTASADFSRLMVSGNAPHLSALRHHVQLSFNHDREIPVSAPPLPDQPLLWLLAEETSGVILQLGLRS